MKILKKLIDVKSIFKKQNILLSKFSDYHLNNILKWKFKKNQRHKTENKKHKKDSTQSEWDG